ncbi:MAG: hypothetical protein Q7S58_04025 [Candidatus Binatus sp.]|uniref:FitA-like ribbon-helix-helix domain-containing protein n=1 Tax=Candidatus Binatus sp. TaxID=2811406 RepID=UPI00272762B8|nr:hypothetical protein [Candidatus Binatus sp.]MDO8431559.1 hypothetical protein [Candidatus Binatus sp.]
MPVTLTIKKVPDKIVARLRRRAAANHRSLQGELMTLLEEASEPKRLTIHELRQAMLKSGLRTPDESTRMIREDHDAR